MNKQKIIITMGDPSGIGPEVTVKALLSRQIKKNANFILVGDSFVLNKIKGFARLKNKIKVINLANVNKKNFSFGMTRVEYGKASLDYIDVALALIKERGIKALVTAPVSKEAIASEKKGFSGQTGYLAAKTASQRTVMFLANDKLKLALVTQHIPLKDVSYVITAEKIREVIRLTNDFLKKYYRIKNPRIAISGLNPHASDNGLIGNEEKKKIIPAIQRLKYRINCSGPYPADSVFVKARENKFDAVVVMYHDQALIALKLTDKKSGVNITAGLPFIRVSPLHGTAFNIAGCDKADPSSMISAVNTAQDFLRYAA